MGGAIRTYWWPTTGQIAQVGPRGNYAGVDFFSLRHFRDKLYAENGSWIRSKERHKRSYRHTQHGFLRYESHNNQIGQRNWPLYRVSAKTRKFKDGKEREGRDVRNSTPKIMGALMLAAKSRGWQ
jgi:hypothetical protein